MTWPAAWEGRATLRPAELARATGLSRSKIQQLLNRGVLTRIKVDREVLIPVDDVRRLLVDDPVPGPQPAPGPSRENGEASPTLSPETQRRLQRLWQRRTG